MKVTFRTHSISPGDHGNAIAPKQFLSRSLRRSGRLGRLPRRSRRRKPSRGCAYARADNVIEDFLRSSKCSKWGRPEQRVIRQTKSRPSVCNTGGISGTLMYGFGGDSWRVQLRKRRNAQAVPYEHPAGMRIWKCRITAASVPRIEIASATPAAVFHGHRRDDAWIG